MFKASRSLALACLTAFALAACGGGGSSPSPAAPKSAANAAGARKVQSIPCSPDSYGYCYVQTYHHVDRTDCGGLHNSIFNATNRYEVYDSTSDLGTYTEYLTDNCSHDPMISWDPSEPSVTYSDPNLP